MNILFIYPVPLPQFQILRFQQGIGSIAAVLKQAGHRVRLLITPQFDIGALDSAVREFKPDLAALSLTSGFEPMGRAITAHLARNHQLPVVWGGIHPTLQPEESLAVEGVFAVCAGEGEYPLLDLCAALEAERDPTAIANLWFKHDGVIIRNPLRPLIADLDSLPFPDRDIFNFNNLLKGFPEAEFMGSRGCPYQCAYCANHALADLYRGRGRYVRFRSVDRLLAEIEEVTRNYPAIEWLGFHDDTFTLRPVWLREFTAKYPARFHHRFWCNATAASIDEETVKLLKQAGCWEVRIGVESGNDHIRMEVLRKKVSREEIVRAFRLLREAGIRRYAFNMIGLPYETPATIEDSIRLNQEIRPDAVFCSVFYPYPGTHARKICEANGWLNRTTVGSYFESDYALDQPTITARQIRYYHNIFRDLARYPRLAPVIRALGRIPVTHSRSLWNALRRIQAKCAELWTAIFGRRETRPFC